MDQFGGLGGGGRGGGRGRGRGGLQLLRAVTMSNAIMANMYRKWRWILLSESLPMGFELCQEVLQCCVDLRLGVWLIRCP
jgi:hypothetical protein